MTRTTLLQILRWLSYPLVIYFGLKFFEPRIVAVLLAVTLLLRQRHAAQRLLTGLTHVDRGVLLTLLGLAMLTGWTNSETLLRFYPATMNLGMLLLFGTSLKSPPSIVERFARLQEPELPPDGIRYTRRVTQVWCVFFIVNGTLAVWTALYASRELWSLYNGLIAYLLMGTLFAGEWLIRRRLHPSHTT